MNKIKDNMFWIKNWIPVVAVIIIGLIWYYFQIINISLKATLLIEAALIIIIFIYQSREKTRT